MGVLNLISNHENYLIKQKINKRKKILIVPE